MISRCVVICVLAVPFFASAQPKLSETWSGKWQCEVLRSNGSRLPMALELQVDDAGRLRGAFAGTVSGSVSGTATAGGAQGQWSVGGRTGSFTLQLSAREGLSGVWNGEGGGTVSGQRALAGKAEDCPSFLLGYVLQDFRDGIGKECGRLEARWGFEGKNDDRLERYLRRNSQLIGHRPDYSAIGAACLARLQGDPRLAEIPEAERPARMAAVTADYYLSKKRLMDGVQSSLESLAALDKLGGMDCLTNGPGLGRSSGTRMLEGVRCSELGSVPGGAEICDRFQTRCAHRTEYRELLETTELAMAQAEALRAELARASFSAEQRRTIEDMIKATEATSPWLSGAAFKRRYASELEQCKRTPSAGEGFCDPQRQKFICHGIRAEAAENRKLVKEQLERFNSAIQCLEGVGTDCDVRKFRETVGRAPPFVGAPEPEFEGPLEGDEKLDTVDAIYANAQFSQAECRQSLRQISDSINDQWKGLAVDSALTIATFGLGAAAGAARLSASAATAARGANVASKVSQVGQRASAYARHGPRMLELAALGLDVADMSRGVAEAVSQCSDAFSQGGAVPRPQPTAPVCPQGGEYQGPRIVEDYRQCVLKAIAWQAAFGALPAVPLGVKKLLDKRTLSRASEALSATSSLSKAKADGVLAVFGSRFGKLTGEELEDGIEALRKAGFSDDEIKKLFTRLAPDVRLLGGRLVQGLEGDVLAQAAVGKHTLTVAKLGDSLLLKVCSSCGKLETRYRNQLTNNPDLARRFEALKGEFDRLPPGAEVPRSLIDRFKVLTGELEAKRELDFLQSHGVRTDAAALPSEGLKKTLDLFRQGALSERQLNEFAAKSDEVVWELEKFFEKNPALRANPDFDAMSVPVVRDRVAALRATIAGLGDGPGSEQLQLALRERVLDALKSRQLFFGGPPSSLMHKDLTFPRTTPALRARARAEGSYRDPINGGTKKFALGEDIEADHIYPVAKIAADPVFQTLPEQLKREVIHNPDNIMPLPAGLNGSKGDRLADEWHTSLRGPNGQKPGLDLAYLNWLRDRQAELKIKLENQIRCLAAGTPPVRCK